MSKSIITATLAAAALCNITDTVAHARGEPTDDGKDKEMIWDEEVIRDLYNSELAKEYANPDFPIIDTLDPGGRCTDISAKKTFNMPLYEQSIAGVPFSAGVAGELALEATNDKLAVTASLSPSIDVFGAVRTPLDVRLSASTTAAGANAVELSVTAFGFTLASDTLATTSTPIALTESFGWSLPNVFTAQLGDSFWIGNIGGRVRNAAVNWNVSATARAHVGGVFLFSVSTAGVQARALVSNDAYAALIATAGFTAQFDPPDFQSDWHDFSLELRFDSTLDMIRSTFGGRGLLVPRNGHWLADAAASLALTDTMGAHMGTTISIPIPIVDDPSYTLSFFDLAPTTWNDAWSYSCTFDKQFK
jgi:hypothetical protein